MRSSEHIAKSTRTQGAFQVRGAARDEEVRAPVACWRGPAERPRELRALAERMERGDEQHPAKEMLSVSDVRKSGDARFWGSLEINGRFEMRVDAAQWRFK